MHTVSILLGFCLVPFSFLAYRFFCFAIFRVLSALVDLYSRDTPQPSFCFSESYAKWFQIPHFFSVLVGVGGDLWN